MTQDRRTKPELRQQLECCDRQRVAKIAELNSVDAQLDTLVVLGKLTRSVAPLTATIRGNIISEALEKLRKQDDELTAWRKWASEHDTTTPPGVASDDALRRSINMKVQCQQDDLDTFRAPTHFGLSIRNSPDGDAHTIEFIFANADLAAEFVRDASEIVSVRGGKRWELRQRNQGEFTVVQLIHLPPTFEPDVPMQDESETSEVLNRLFRRLMDPYMATKGHRIASLRDGCPEAPRR